MKYPDHQWIVSERHHLRNGRKMGYVWKCIRCLVTITKIETGYPLLTEIAKDGINLNCDMSAVVGVMDS